MEFIILGSISVAVIVLWGLCLARISCPFQRGKREPGNW